MAPALGFNFKNASSLAPGSENMEEHFTHKVAEHVPGSMRRILIWIQTTATGVIHFFNGSS
jgi:hypothetical protein